MYTASNAFHAAVQANNPQKILFLFSDAVFSNEDVDVNTGVEFHESFSLEQDLAIGQALSGELNFALFNDYGDLDEYGFGEFTATLGVQLTDSEYTETGSCSAVIGNDTYVGYNASPYIKKNGTALSDQPSFAVKSILVQDTTVYAIGANGECMRWVNGTGASYTLNDFMKRKMMKRPGTGFAYDSQNRILVERDGTREKTYEFVPFGVFIADRPNVPDVIRIDFTCNDRMTKFDKDMPDSTTLGITYPTTIGTLFTKICQHFGVPYLTNSFINSGASIPSVPDEFENSTARTVIAWIAEAAGCNAMMNRDGKLEMRWVKNTGVELDENGYVEFRPYWYETTKVNKLLNRDTNGSAEKSHGSGSNAYLIQDNPLLKGYE